MDAIDYKALAKELLDNGYSVKQETWVLESELYKISRIFDSQNNLIWLVVERVYSNLVKQAVLYLETTPAQIWYDWLVKNGRLQSEQPEEPLPPKPGFMQNNYHVNIKLDYSLKPSEALWYHLNQWSSKSKNSTSS